MKRKPDQNPGVFPGCHLFLMLACVILTGPGLFARGKAAEAEKPVLNNEWLLCVTNFDISALPENRQAVGSVITRTLVDTLRLVSYRIRISPEYAYYEGYAWSQTRASAAKSLSQKQDERSLLLYRGDANWKYRQDLKRVNGEINKLREELAKKEAEMPLINGEPSFAITQSNIEEVFPEPPREGRERRFCQEQRADAFLTGHIREYYNRYYVTLRLYTLYTGSFIYEDSIIFSPDDINGAVDEIAGRLTAVLAGSRPAAVAVHAEPPETLVLINQSFAGRGTVDAHEHPPGKVTVALSAEDRRPETIETELLPGELTSITASLLPQHYADVRITAPGAEQAQVYQGAMYVGEAPLTIRLPLNQLNYLSVETSGGQLGKAAFASPSETGGPYVLSMKPKTVFPASEQRVNKARRAYYWSWGGTWITGIAAWLVTGLVRSQVDSLNYAGVNPGPAPGSANDIRQFINDTERMRDVSTGLMAAVGVAAAIEIFQMARYIYIATEDTTPMVKTTQEDRNQP